MSDRYEFALDTLADPTTLVRQVLAENPPDHVGTEWALETNALVLATLHGTHRWFLVQGPFGTDYDKIEYVVRPELQPEIFLARCLLDQEKRIKALRKQRNSIRRAMRRVQQMEGRYGGEERQNGRRTTSRNRKPGH
jgi:hypothetical protein